MLILYVKNITNKILTLFNLSYTDKGNLPKKGVLLVSNELISLIVAPILVGIAIELFAWWLDKQDDD